MTVNIWDKFDFKQTYSKKLKCAMDKMASELEEKAEGLLYVSFNTELVYDNDSIDEKYRGYEYMHTFRVEISYSGYGKNICTILEGKNKKKLLLYSSYDFIDDYECFNNLSDIHKMFKYISENKYVIHIIKGLYENGL